MVESFASCYTSLTRKADISSSLEVINIEDVRNDDEDDYATLERPTKRVNELAPMARVKDKDNEAKVRLLTKAVSGTRWGLHAQQRVPVEPSFQSLTNALYESMRELGTYQQKESGGRAEHTGAFHKSLGKNEKKNDDDKKKAIETFMAKLLEL